MRYSLQKGFCFICGLALEWDVNTTWIHTHVCSRECFREFKWRETLSMLNKEYYEQQD